MTDSRFPRVSWVYVVFLPEADRSTSTNRPSASYSYVFEPWARLAEEIATHNNTLVIAYRKLLHFMTVNLPETFSRANRSNAWRNAQTKIQNALGCNRRNSVSGRLCDLKQLIRGTNGLKLASFAANSLPMQTQVCHWVVSDRNGFTYFLMLVLAVFKTHPKVNAFYLSVIQFCLSIRLSKKFRRGRSGRQGGLRRICQSIIMEYA